MSYPGRRAAAAGAVLALALGCRPPDGRAEGPAPCLEWAPAPVDLTGTMLEQMRHDDAAPDPVAGPGAAEIALVLQLDHARCLPGGDSGRRFEVVPPEVRRGELFTLVGARVRVWGTLAPAAGTAHHADILLQVDSFLPPSPER